MKNLKIYIVGILGLGLGFLVAYFLLSSQTSSHSTPTESTSSHNHDESQGNAIENQIWTCSMHPQIRQNEPGDCPICGMDLIPASLAQSENSLGFQMSEEAIKLAQVQTTTLAPSTPDHSLTLTLTGKIQTDETQSASLVSHIPGRIEKLYVSYTGEKISKGQKIARIYSPELITAQKELLEAHKMKDLSPGLLEAAKNKLKYWKISTESIEQIIQSGVIQENFDLFAEHSGVVQRKRVSVGDYLTTGAVLFDIDNLNRLWALFDVYEHELPNIKLGQSVEFKTPAVKNKTFKAKITFINPVINPQTRVATIRAEVNNHSGLLKPEMFITGSLDLYKNSKNLIVPKSAILWTGRRSVVYVQLPNTAVPSFEYREVELGESIASGYYVLSGLSEGEKVVTHGSFVIDAAAQLNNQASMMNKHLLKEQNNSKEILPDYTSSTPIAFKRQLEKVAEAYLKVSDALVNGHTEQSNIAAQALLQNLSKIDETVLPEKALTFWSETLKELEMRGKEIIAASSLSDQRTQFQHLSDALIQSLQVFGISAGQYFVQYCPMVNQNQGAYWLSAQEEILNPYFGEAMLTCGTNEAMIDPHSVSRSDSEQGHSSTSIHQH